MRGQVKAIVSSRSCRHSCYITGSGNFAIAIAKRISSKQSKSVCASPSSDNMTTSGLVFPALQKIPIKTCYNTRNSFIAPAWCWDKAYGRFLNSFSESFDSI